MPDPLIDMNAPDPSAPNPGAPEAAAPNGDGSQHLNQQAVQKPDFLSADLWDAEKNQPKHDEVLKQFGELSKFKSESDAKLAAVPEKADGYKLPEKLVDDEVAKIIPQGMDITLDEKDPRLAFFREYAHANKLSQEQFDAGVQGFLKLEIMQEKAFADATEAENKKLGTQADQRKGAVKSWLLSQIGEADAKAILGSVFSAAQFEAFERLQAKFSNNGNVIPFQQRRDEPQAPAADQRPAEDRLYPTMKG